MSSTLSYNKISVINFSFFKVVICLGYNMKIFERYVDTAVPNGFVNFLIYLALFLSYLQVW